jgi:hypothetical protein
MKRLGIEGPTMPAQTNSSTCILEAQGDLTELKAALARLKARLSSGLSSDAVLEIANSAGPVDRLAAELWFGMDY